MSTVYQIQQTGFRDKATGAFVPFDVRPARKFGEVITLLPNDRGDPALAPGPMIQHMRQKLVRFSSEDYLLPMGSPAALCAAAIVAYKASGGPVNVLLWDRAERDYYVSTLEV